MCHCIFHIFIHILLLLISEYLLLSDTDDNSPMAILPNMDQMPALKLPEENTPKLLVVPEFSDAPIQCDVAMNARPDVPVYWFRNGEQIPNPQSRDARTNGLLYLPNIRMSDAGLYTCVLGDGEATSSTRVIVTEPTLGPGKNKLMRLKTKLVILLYLEVFGSINDFLIDN